MHVADQKVLIISQQPNMFNKLAKYLEVAASPRKLYAYEKFNKYLGISLPL